MTQADQSQLVSLLNKINDNFDEEDNEMTPDYFGDLVESCRGTTISVLKSVRDNVFSCGKECSKVKVGKGKAPIMTAADGKFCNILTNFRKK